MKSSIWYLPLALLAGFGLASTLATHAYAQDSHNDMAPLPPPPPATPPLPPGTQPPCPTGVSSQLTPHPPEGYIPPSEEVLRYMHLFNEVISDDAVADQSAKKGELDWADAWRSRLEKQSALSAAEATQVKQIAAQWKQDEADRMQRAAEVAAKWRSTHPPTVVNGRPSRPSPYTDPEHRALNQEQWDLVNKAIAQLVTTLGTKSFARLDLYTRHMDDQMKAMEVPCKPADPSKGEAK